LHAAKVRADAEDSFLVDAEKGAGVGAESLSIDLGRELPFRLRDKKISFKRES
jgi:hypothetical protein